MPQHITSLHSRAGSLPQAPGKLTREHRCRHKQAHRQLAPWPLFLHSQVTRVKGVLFTAKRGGMREGVLKQGTIWFRSRLLIQDPNGTLRACRAFLMALRFPSLPTLGN